MRICNLVETLMSWRSRPPLPMARGKETRRRPAACRLAVEALEDRCVPASLSIHDATVLEGLSGTKNAAVVVSLSAPSTKPVTVNYSTLNGTARAGSDYDAVSGKLTFAKGETSKTILVPVYGDRLAENSEWFNVSLDGAKGATVADGVGTVTITDEHTPRLTVSSEAAWEGGFLTLTVSLSAALDQAFTVNFATQDAGPLPDQRNWAYAGLDYLATSGTLTFAPGETTKTISVKILDDGLFEYDEFFNVRLSDASANVLLVGGQGSIYGEYGTWEL
jgi:hypothetical protein